MSSSVKRRPKQEWCAFYTPAGRMVTKPAGKRPRNMHPEDWCADKTAFKSHGVQIVDKKDGHPVRAGNKSLSLIEKAREEVLKRAHAMSPGLAEHLQRCERFHQLKEMPSRSKPLKCEVCNTRDALEKIGSGYEYLWHCQECLQDPVYVNYYD